MDVDDWDGRLQEAECGEDASRGPNPPDTEWKRTDTGFGLQPPQKASTDTPRESNDAGERDVAFGAWEVKMEENEPAKQWSRESDVEMNGTSGKHRFEQLRDENRGDEDVAKQVSEESGVSGNKDSTSCDRPQPNSEHTGDANLPTPLQRKPANLAALVPGLMQSCQLDSEDVESREDGSQDWTIQAARQQDFLPGWEGPVKKRRPQKRRLPNGGEDDDYEPGLRLHRPRKFSPGGVAKHRASGRTRLILAGTASTIGDVDPGWSSPKGAMVLVAKTLTKSDTLGRVILPRIAVESNMSFLTSYRAYTLAVRDLEGKPWEFVVKSWANGSEQRRVYVLEQAGGFLRSNRLQEGDVVGICCDESGNLVVAANTEALQQAAAQPNYARPKPSPAAPRGQAQEAAQPVAARGSALASPAYQRRPRRSCSTSLDSAIGEPAAGVTSLPLSDADLRDGCVRLSGGFEGDMLAQAAGCLTVKDDVGQVWSLSLAPSGAPRDAILLSGLAGFLRHQAARIGDTVHITSSADTSLLIRIEQAHEDRGQKGMQRRSSATLDSQGSRMPMRSAFSAAAGNEAGAQTRGRTRVDTNLDENWAQAVPVQIPRGPRDSSGSKRSRCGWGAAAARKSVDLNREDSIAAEVLVSLSEPDRTWSLPEGQEAAREAMWAAESAARLVASDAPGSSAAMFM